MTKDRTRTRRYPQARKALGQPAAPGPSPEVSEDALGLAPGYRTPVVRPGLAVRPGTPGESAPLEQTAKQVFLSESEGGGGEVSVLIRDDLFLDLRCSIDVESDGRVKATFFVQDANLRRLLEGEAGRLRSNLEGRGLKVREVAVVMETPEEG